MSKITDCRPIALSAPYVRPRTTPEHPSNRPRNCVWLSIETDAGLTGWGEAYIGCYATEVTLACLRRLVGGLPGRAVGDVPKLLDDLRYQNRYWAMRGIGAQALSAVESALWDLAAQEQGVPLWRLLSADDAAAPVMPYASAGEFRFSPEQIFDDAAYFAGLGYRAYKMRIGGSRLDAERPDQLGWDVERVAAARQALGPERLLLVDAAVPQRPDTWDLDRARTYFEALAPYRIGFFEEPAMTYDVDAYRELRNLGLIPPAGGESFCCPEEFEPFFRAGAYGVAQPDAAVAGGPASCVEIGRRALSTGAGVALHCWSAGVGIAQNLHAGWALSGLLTMEWPQAAHAPATDPVAGLYRFEDGYLYPGEKPGLGVTITGEWLARYVWTGGGDRDY